MTEDIAFFFIAAFVGAMGCFAGYSLERGSWVNDCKTLQAHRDGTDIYKCEPVKKEQP